MVTQQLSQRSVERYRSVITAAKTTYQKCQTVTTVGLIDRKNEDRLAALDLRNGALRSSEIHCFDVIVVDQCRNRSSADPDFITLKGRLAPQGVILLQRRTWFTRLMGGFLSRRLDDEEDGLFGRGHDRREAALRRSALYLAPFEVKSGSKNEAWLIASPEPIADTRIRDQIGRVATDYLRAVGPVIAGGHLLGI